MTNVGRMRVVGVICSALGIPGCGGWTQPSDFHGDGDSDGEQPTGNGPTSNDDAPVDGGSCSIAMHDEQLCVDPEGGSTGTTTTGAAESSSGSGSSSSGEADSSTEGSGSTSTGSSSGTSDGSETGHGSETSASESSASESSGGNTTSAALCPAPHEIDASDACDHSWPLENSVVGPTMRGGQCCYTVTCESTQCSSGRPFVIGDEARVAAVDRRDDWMRAYAPDLDGLDPATRAQLAAAWLADAQAEHASVASFARFALELLSVGAPPELVADAHAAAGDEILHAQICFALASAYGGVGHGPGPLEIDGALSRCGDLAAIVRATLEEGCVGETLAALEAEAAIAHADDPVVRAALTRIAADEARHAALAWRTLDWALAHGGAELRIAVREGLGHAELELTRRLAAMPRAGSDGRMPWSERRALLTSAWRDVVEPLVRRVAPARGIASAAAAHGRSLRARAGAIASRA